MKTESRARIRPFLAGVLLTVVVILAAWLVWRLDLFSPRPRFDTLPEPLTPAVLTEYAERFERRVERVSDNLYVAIGFALGNSILIITDAGNIIVDTTESLEAAQEIKEEFTAISDRPTVAIIYTHGHPDHILGTAAFLDGGNPVEIYAHEKTNDFLNEQFGQMHPILNLRGMRQFGTYLPEGYVPCSALGPGLRFDHERITSFVFPTTVFSGELRLEIGGLELVLMDAPGETDDQIMVWLPEQRILLCGDNYYPAFPNIYTIRGTPPRPVRQWINTLDRMRDLGAEILVPGHTEPVHGAERIEELLTAYRDAIQYVHDAVVRGANEGKTPDQLVEEIRLPAHLQAYPELRELYGEVSLSVRAIYDGYLGWFDGNAATLHPLSTAQRAERIAVLAGGVENLREAAAVALRDGDFQWAAELADMLLALDPGCADALSIKADALYRLGEASANSNARSYYFTQSLELSGHLRPAGKLQVDTSLAHQVPLEMLFENMSVRLDPCAAIDTVMTAHLIMTDSGEEYTVAVRRGIAEIRPGLRYEADLVVRVEEKLWKELAFNLRSPVTELAAGRLKVEGNKVLLLKKFFDLFKR